MTHTSGPWELDGRSIYALNDAKTSNRFYAHVQGGYIETYDVHTPNEELDANARLIAASPEMFKACEEIAALLVPGPHIDAKDGMTKALDALDIARAKARAGINKALNG